jgi:hypothetical protein
VRARACRRVVSAITTTTTTTLHPSTETRPTKTQRRIDAEQPIRSCARDGSSTRLARRVWSVTALQRIPKEVVKSMAQRRGNDSCRCGPNQDSKHARVLCKAPLKVEGRGEGGSGGGQETQHVRQTP